MKRSPLTAARKHLTDAQLVAFLHAAAQDGHALAPRMFCERLATGCTLDELFAVQPDDEMSMQAVLRVRRIREHTYRITTGYEGAVGDGADWTVTFDATGAPLHCEVGVMWVC